MLVVKIGSYKQKSAGKNPTPIFMSVYYSTMNCLISAKKAEASSVCASRAIGLERSKLKIPAQAVQNFVDEMNHTNMYLKLAENPDVDVIGHCATVVCPFDYEKCLKKFKEYGKLVELNESTILWKNTRENYIEILKICKKYDIPIIGMEPAVKKAVENMTGLKVEEVNVHVQGVNTESLTEESKEEETEETNSNPEE